MKSVHLNAKGIGNASIDLSIYKHPPPSIALLGRMRLAHTALTIRPQGAVWCLLVLSSLRPMAWLHGPRSKARPSAER